MDNLHRDISRLENTVFDLIIVGAGIFGAAAAWEAASRGLSVVLLEKADFAHATSSNHFKMVHGGIRYLQHMDIRRVRESAHERSALLRIAPHMVHPLPIVMPTYGHGLKSKAFLGAGMYAYDLLTADRNSGLPESHRIPMGGFLTRSKVLELFPGLKPEGLTGGAVFYDGQMRNPPRLVISFIRSAAALGGLAYNYLEVNSFIRQRNRITGVQATDKVTGKNLSIASRMVLNAAGPWAHRLAEGLDLEIRPKPTFSRDLAFVVPRKFDHPMAIAFSTESKDSDSVLDRGGRHLFAVPWKDHTLIGVWHKVHHDPPDDIQVDKGEILSYLQEVNAGYPGLDLQYEEVSLINTGLTLFGDENQQKREQLSFGKRSMLINHHQEDKLKGLITLIGVRATTARGMASKAIDMVFYGIDRPAVSSRSDAIPIYGGDIVRINEVESYASMQLNGFFSKNQIRSLIGNYGSRYLKIVRYGLRHPDLLNPIEGTTVLKAEIAHAIIEEMAIHLDDMVLRRLALGTGRLPSDQTLSDTARTMALFLGWNNRQIQGEIDRLKSLFPKLGMRFS